MSTTLLEKPKAGSYRTPMEVTHLRKYRDTSYYICPRCNIPMEREFMAYCDHCGQCLSWRQYKKVTVVK